MSMERAGLSIQFALCIYEQGFNAGSEGSGGENWPLSSYRSLLASRTMLYSPQKAGEKQTTSLYERCWILGSSNLFFGIKAVRGAYPDPALHMKSPL